MTTGQFTGACWSAVLVMLNWKQ